MSTHTHPSLRVGSTVKTLLFGPARISRILGDEVHLVAVDTKVQLMLSPQSALRRVLVPAKRSEK